MDYRPDRFDAILSGENERLKKCSPTAPGGEVSGLVADIRGPEKRAGHKPERLAKTANTGSSSVNLWREPPLEEFRKRIRVHGGKSIRGQEGTVAAVGGRNLEKIIREALISLGGQSEGR